MPLSVQNRWIMDYETKILNVIPYLLSTLNEIFNITLKCDLDLTIFVRILEVSPQFMHTTVHVVTALIVHI